MDSILKSYYLTGLTGFSGFFSFLVSSLRAVSPTGWKQETGNIKKNPVYPVKEFFI